MNWSAETLIFYFDKVQFLIIDNMIHGIPYNTLQGTVILVKFININYKFRSTVGYNQDSNILIYCTYKREN